MRDQVTIDRDHTVNVEYECNTRVKIVCAYLNQMVSKTFFYNFRRKDKLFQKLNFSFFSQHSIAAV